MATGMNTADSAPSPWRARCGTTSSVTSGSAISEPTRCAKVPKRRIHTDRDMPATNTVAPAQGTWRNRVPTPTLARATRGSASNASLRPRRSPARWLRASDNDSTTPRTADAGPGSSHWLQASVPSIASKATAASRSERRRVRATEDMVDEGGWRREGRRSGFGSPDFVRDLRRRAPSVPAPN